MNLSISNFRYFFKTIFSYLKILVVLVIAMELSLFVLQKLNMLPFNGPSYDASLVQKTNLYADMNPLHGVWRFPNAKARISGGCYDAMNYSNSIGARDDEWKEGEYEKSAIVLGDSYIEGYGVNEEYRATEVFEKKSGIKMKNMAISGHFGPTQYRLLYKRFKDEITHDYVFVGLNLPNELKDEDYEKWKNKSRYRPYLTGEYPNYELTYGSVPLSKSIFTEKKGISSLVKNVLNEYSQIYHFILFYSTKLKVTYWDMNLKEEASEEALDTQNLDRIRYNLEQIDSLSGDRKVFVFRVPSEKTEIEIDRNYNYLKRKTNKTGNIIFLDFPANFQVPKNLYFNCDPHWNQEGNKYVGEGLYQAFKAAFYTDKL
ncbi:MAG TPA: hypothetical protein VFM70_04070 [Salinimicrobium sp.]|nr:hypothetical protein [Salinimicrobium sp.]